MAYSCLSYTNMVCNGHYVKDGERWASIPRDSRLAHLRQLAPEAARQNREAAPGLGIEVLVVEVEGRREAFAFPLVAAPQREEASDPAVQPCARVLRELRHQARQDVLG